MADDTRSIKATCLCGSPEHELALSSSAFPLQAVFCHCDSCRHVTGTLCITMVAGLPSVYQPAQQLLDKLVPYDFSKRLTLFHCRVCGAQMFFRCWKDSEDNSKGAAWDVACGTLPYADEIFVVDSHEHIADTLDGGFSDFLTYVNGIPVNHWPHRLRKGEGLPEFTDEKLPLYWRDSSRSIPITKPSDRLYCRCKCNAVEFCVSRSLESQDKSLGGDVGSSTDSNNKFPATVCSCSRCRFSTGMEWAEWASIPIANMYSEGSLTQPFRWDLSTMQHYRSPGKAARYFCKTCGAATFYSDDKSPDIMKVAVGLLNAPEGARAESWLEFDTAFFHRPNPVDKPESLTVALARGLGSFDEREKSNQTSRE